MFRKSSERGEARREEREGEVRDAAKVIESKKQTKSIIFPVATRGRGERLCEGKRK